MGRVVNLIGKAGVFPVWALSWGAGICRRSLDGRFEGGLCSLCGLRRYDAPKTPPRWRTRYSYRRFCRCCGVIVSWGRRFCHPRWWV